MNRFFTIILLGFISIPLNSQDSQPSKIIISQNGDGNFYFDYSLSQGETAYSISRKFNQPIASLKRINNGRNLSALSQKEEIRVPYSRELLIDPSESSPTALIYITQPKETLYSIGKNYFQIDLKDIQSLNNLEDNNIRIGQELIIGYIDLERGNSDVDRDYIHKNALAIESEEEKDSEGVLRENDSDFPKKSNSSNYQKTKEIHKSYSLTDLIEMIDDEETTFQPVDPETENEEAEYFEMTSEKGLAYTENVNMDGNDLYVLHPNAKVGTEMEITYPMLNKTVKAKVISEFPKELYPKNISIVISPSVAKALGAKDDQFRVEMKFITD